jgi:hypothetical protein
MESRHAKLLGWTGAVKNRLCTVCARSYTQTDVSLFQYFPDTQVCQACYEKMSQDPGTCFGKAYEPEHIDCFKLCPDRRVCRTWKEGPMPRIIRLGERNRHLALQYLKQHKILKEKVKRRRKGENHPFTKGSILRACFDKVAKGTTLQDLREYCGKLGANFQLVFRKLRVEIARGYEWEWLEDDAGNIKIEFERPGNDS